MRVGPGSRPFSWGLRWCHYKLLLRSEDAAGFSECLSLAVARCLARRDAFGGTGWVTGATLKKGKGEIFFANPKGEKLAFGFCDGVLFGIL